ncbi:hypothetical protein HDU84_007856 [Entophlyctis sp. JEL0112]|nr:hypothetical protein HDU84_007856 [Entophlyctis sp. JEL0112]
MNPKVAIADETEILEYFESIMVKRFKSVSFRTSPYPLRDEQWIERYKITKELFAWLLEKLVPFLTPSENDSDISLTYFAADTKIFIFLTFLAFEIDSKFRDPIDTLLLDYFSNSLSRQEVIAVIMQVRDVILQRIYAHKYTHDLFALAFECVFGKFSFLYDAIPHRLRIQTSSPNVQQSNSSVIEKPKSCVSGAPPGTAVRNSTAVAEAWETGPSKRARVTSAESSVPRYGASAAQAQVRSAPPAVAAMHVVQGAAGDISRATILARTRRATLAVAQRLQHRREGLIGAASGAGDTTSSSPPSGVVRDIRNWRTLLADDGERIELDGCEPILGTVPEDTAGEAAAASTLTVAAAPCDNVDYDKSDAEESGYVNDEDNDENAFDVEEEEEEAEEFADDEDGAEDEDNVENQENVENTTDLDGVAEDEDEDSDAVDVFE